MTLSAPLSLLFRAGLGAVAGSISRDKIEKNNETKMPEASERKVYKRGKWIALMSPATRKKRLRY